MIIAILLLSVMSGLAWAPTGSWKTVRVHKNIRSTAYSSKQPEEGNLLCNGKSAKNERGAGASRNGPFKQGEHIRLPCGEIRVIDDKTAKSTDRKWKRQVVDLRYYESIKSKAETHKVCKELRKFDRGRIDIEVVEYSEDCYVMKGE